LHSLSLLNGTAVSTLVNSLASFLICFLTVSR
jgi:hypothetical protein